MAADKLDAAKLLQFPTVIGAVVPIVNLDGVAADAAEAQRRGAGRHLSGQDHQLERRQDRRAQHGRQAARHRRSRRSIAPTARARPSCSPPTSPPSAPDWKSDVGAATSVQWPAGAGAKGNDGVAGTVKNTEGAIGYVEYVYAASNNADHDAAARTRPASSSSRPSRPSRPPPPRRDWKGAKDFAASMIDMRRRRRLADRLRDLHPAAQGPQGPGQVAPRS